MTFFIVFILYSHGKQGRVLQKRLHREVLKIMQMENQQVNSGSIVLPNYA